MTPYRNSWIIFTIDSALSYTEKILVFSLLSTNCATLVAICIYFATKEIS